jgi:hypothetical protein
MLLLAGCSPAAQTNDAGSAAGPGQAQATPVVEPTPDVPGEPETDQVTRRNGGAPAPTPTSNGETRSSRTGWSQIAVGGRGEAYPPSDPAPTLLSVTAVPNGATYLGGGYLDIHGSAFRKNLFEFTIGSPASGWAETFLLQRPLVPVAQEMPLLVVWHKFGSSHLDAQFNTDFLAEAESRGWFVVAPLSAATKHFGSTEAEINTEVVLDFVLNYFGNEIDNDRIYSVGFSMGAGASLSYAANHVDPSKPMFAAIVTHTGGGALEHTYATSPDDDDVDDNLQTGQNLETPDILDFWFGGSPAAFPFEYQRHSVMSIDGFGVVDHATSMITNLVHMPINTWYAVNDPKIAILTQTQIIQSEFLSTYGGTSVVTQIPGAAHTWNTVDEVAVLDWLEQFTLNIPTSGSTLADENGIWFHFDVEQDATGAFTPFDWNVDVATNTLTIENTGNLQRISVDTAGAGLDPAAALTLVTGTADATGDEIRFLGVTSAPTAVTRDTVADPNWVYDSQAQTLTIMEADGLPHTWAVSFL